MPSKLETELQQQIRHLVSICGELADIVETTNKAMVVYAADSDVSDVIDSQAVRTLDKARRIMGIARQYT